MLGNIGRRAAVLAAEREPLDKTQSDERGGSSDPDRGVVRKDSNQERRQAHHDDGDEKRVFASDDVADATEEERAEGTHRETCGERQESKDEGRRLIDAAEELAADDCCERTVKVEIIPLEYGSQR